VKRDVPRLLVLGILSLTLLPRLARACKCEVSFGTCREVGASDLIFIGTVQSIEPIFMNRWYMTSQSPMRSLNDAYTDAQAHPSAETLARLKDTYLKLFPGLAPDEKRWLQAADTIHDVTSLFSYALDRGMRVRLKVRTLFKHEDDDDDAPKKGDAKDDKDQKDQKAKDDDDKKAEPDFFDVWTTFDDCGYDFQIGETHLVYANNDEFGDYYFTSSCNRTRRVSDAGEDLAYLYFYKDYPEQSSRLEGFTSTERLDFDQQHDPETVNSPVEGVIVELQSDRLKRYAQSDGNGRFLFDGLPEGEYQLSAYANGYPLNAQLLAGPKMLHIKTKSCARQIFLLPKKTDR
jgi:Carboxypeptidase regulatory-like domain